VYMNDGDWVESCTALVEHHTGRWEIVTWTKESDDVDLDTDSNTHKRSQRPARTNRDTVSHSTELRASPKHHQVAAEV